MLCFTACVLYIQVYEDGIKELQLLKDQLEDNVNEATAMAGGAGSGSGAAGRVSPANSRAAVQIV